ncbi:hypothetical protein SAMN05421847_0121 [Halpernia humi]|uniref:Uncharacterized protein n=1 Tax=Halpernia humi TaxID=493375 RepID=A0A1H5SGQ1_9FLAO|nr:hypothetical protein [Halpernia humi]SEF48971.1 hypothetical protein SAMN05421847_0121 [Halpernia humi]
MKNLLYILLIISSANCTAQQLSDYKYVYVPKDFKEFENNQYHLNSTLVSKLKEKGYQVLQEVQGNWPEELKQNPCKVAKINILKSGNIFTNKLTFEATDCNGKAFLSQEGKSSEKDYEIGYQQALQKSMVNLQKSSPIKEISEVKVDLANENSSSKIANLDKKSNEKTNKKESAIIEDKTKKPYSDIISPAKNQNYFNNNTKYQKKPIGSGQFILISPDTSTPFATFRESSKKDVYHIILRDGTTTLGYLENENLVIELPNKDGSFRKEIFVEK